MTTLRKVQQWYTPSLLEEERSGEGNGRSSSRDLWPSYEWKNISQEKILRIDYFWNTMETDFMDYVKSCHDCQTHTNLNHVPPSELYSMTSTWLFSVWGIDVIGRITLKASNGHEYILVAIDYFTKWVKAASCSILKAKHVPWFLENNIICWFRVP